MFYIFFQSTILYIQLFLNVRLICIFLFIWSDQINSNYIDKTY
jgi:hypothetical protein